MTTADYLKIKCKIIHTWSKLLQNLLLELQFSFVWVIQPKTNVINLANHKGHRQHSEQMNQNKAQRNEIKPKMQNVGKVVLLVLSEDNKVQWVSKWIITYYMVCSMVCGGAVAFQVMVSALVSGSNSSGSSPGWGHCVEFLGKTLIRTSRLQGFTFT